MQRPKGVKRYSNFDSFIAFGQVRRLNGLADPEAYPSCVEKLHALLESSPRIASRTETSPRHEYRYMNDDENKPADKDAPRGMSDELVDGDTFDITDDPAKKEEEPLEPHDKTS